MATVNDLVAKLKELGGSANNPDLKAALAVKDKDWETIKTEALKKGLVVTGRGFGGRLSLSDAFLGNQGSNAQPVFQMPSTAPYGALKGKKLMTVDKEGKPLGKLLTIQELAVTEGMAVVVVE